MDNRDGPNDDADDAGRGCLRGESTPNEYGSGVQHSSSNDDNDFKCCKMQFVRM